MTIKYSKQAVEQRLVRQDWSKIEVVEPDEFDRQLLQEAKNDPDCHSFVSLGEAVKILDAL